MEESGIEDLRLQQPRWPPIVTTQLVTREVTVPGTTLASPPPHYQEVRQLEGLPAVQTGDQQRARATTAGHQHHRLREHPREKFLTSTILDMKEDAMLGKFLLASGARGRS